MSPTVIVDDQASSLKVDGADCLGVAGIVVLVNSIGQSTVSRAVYGLVLGWTQWEAEGTH